MARTAQQNEAMRIATRATIESAAVRVFARRGFAAASVRHIADEAGLSIGSIYRHFAGKEELFDELLDRAASGLEDAAIRLSGDGDPRALIRAFTETHLRDLVEENGAAEFSMVMNQCFTTDTPAGTVDRLTPSHRALWGAFAALVRRGQLDGRFAPGDPNAITAHYFAALAGVTTMRLALNDGFAGPDVDLIERLLTEGPER